MYGAIIGAIAGGVAGGVVNAIAAKQNTKNRVDAYNKAAQSLRDAAEKYSGQAATNSERAAAFEEARKQSNYDLGLQGMQGNQNTNGSNAYINGFNQGMNNKKTENQANLNMATADANRLLNNDITQANAQQQMWQTGMNAAGGLADVVKNVSDENAKESINNDSGLPESDIEDSLRQLETIQYKYKNPDQPGADDELHESGFTAQSLEKTPLGKDVVSEGEDGYKRIDQWKLMEALTAGIAQLQREIDSLSSNKEEA